MLFHAVYLINCASEDREIREKSLNSLTIALRSGAALGARGVVLHAGSALLGADEKATAKAIDRAAQVIAEALAESEGCPLHLENTAGSGGTLGRSFHELAALIEKAGGDERLGMCLDSCHLYASGFDVRTPKSLAEVIDECVEIVGLERLGSLHVNDSKTALGSNVDRHAPLGEGELGRGGLCDVPVRAALRGPARDLRGPGHRGQGAGEGRRRPHARAARGGPGGPALATA